MEKTIMKIWLVLSYVLFSESNALRNQQALSKTPAIVTTVHPEMVIFSFASQANWHERNSIVRYPSVIILIFWWKYILVYLSYQNFG